MQLRREEGDFEAKSQFSFSNSRTSVCVCLLPKMKLFLVFLLICMVNCEEERCVSLSECNSLLKLYEEQGLDVLRHYQTCGVSQVCIFDQILA